jgi:hypothetical protein
MAKSRTGATPIVVLAVRLRIFYCNIAEINNNQSIEFKWSKPKTQNTSRKAIFGKNSQANMMRITFTF